MDKGETDLDMREDCVEQDGFLYVPAFSLRNYQRVGFVLLLLLIIDFYWKGVNWLNFLNNYNMHGILADDMVFV
jgi:SNF2 family DNA or RNA helicase